MPERHTGFPNAIILPMALGTILNPLNSSMIALALVAIATDFGESAAQVTWVVSAFYLGACVAQPVMGRFADRFGPRRVFVAGMVIALLAGLIGPFAPNLGVLIVVRVIQAIGTSAAFPSAVALIRELAASRGFDAQTGLSTIATANITGAAIGPIVGGLAMLVGGWQALFWLNVPFTVIAAVVVWFTVPKDTGRETISVQAVLAESDPVGILLFTTAVGSLIVSLMSITGSPLYWLFPVPVLAALAFVWWENRVAHPFLKLKVLSANRTLMGVYLHFLVFNIVFLGALFGIPQWLEAVREISPAGVGFLMLPLAALGGLTTPLASRLIRSWGVRPMLIIGSALLVVGAVLLFFFTDGMPLWFVLVTCAFFGIPYAFTNLGLQTRLYSAAPSGEIGVAAGLFQTSRFLGGILCTSILGFAFAAKVDTAALHIVALSMATSCVLLLAMSIVFGKQGKKSEEAA